MDIVKKLNILLNENLIQIYNNNSIIIIIIIINGNLKLIKNKTFGRTIVNRHGVHDQIKSRRNLKKYY
jgi:hypothetical protein